MKKIGIYGGSFDPVHFAHLTVAEQIREEFDLDLIIWMPTFQNPFKSTHNESDKIRLEMLNLAIQDNPDFLIEDYEIKEKNPYTVVSLKALKKKYGIDNQYFLMIGSDNIKNFHLWKDSKKILELCTLIVFSRDKNTQQLKKQFPFALFCDTLQYTLSSTFIRDKIQKNQSIRYLTPDLVIEYIIKNNLYQNLS